MSNTGLKMRAENHFPDIIGINLDYALEEYNWEGWMPVSDDAVTVTGFWNKNKGEADRDIYSLENRGAYIKKL